MLPLLDYIRGYYSLASKKPQHGLPKGSNCEEVSIMPVLGKV